MPGCGRGYLAVVAVAAAAPSAAVAALGLTAHAARGTAMSSVPGGSPCVLRRLCPTRDRPRHLASSACRHPGMLRTWTMLSSSFFLPSLAHPEVPKGFRVVAAAAAAAPRDGRLRREPFFVDL